MRTVTFDPAEWQLVPKEADHKMVDAVWDSDAADYVGEHKRIHNVYLAYQDMLAAAPDYQESEPADVDGLDDAIQHAEQVALTCENPDCAAEHGQLVVWLRELQYPEDSPSRNRMFARAREAEYIANEIRGETK